MIELTEREGDRRVPGGRARGRLAFTPLGRVYPADDETVAVTAGATILADVSDDVEFLVMATRKGFIKKTNLSEYAGIGIRRLGLIAIKLRKGDELVAVSSARRGDRILLATRKGITFKESDARPMGRPTQGVTGIRLAKGDDVVGMGIVRPRTEVLSVTANGYGKRTGVDEFPTQGRGGQGVILHSLSTQTGRVVFVKIVDETTESVTVPQPRGRQLSVAINRLRPAGRPWMGRRLT